MTTITATITAADPIPVVTVGVEITNPGAVTSWEVTRESAGIAVSLWLGTTSSGAMSFVDFTAPLGVPCTYRVTVTYADFTSGAASTTATITGTIGCYLTDPATATTIRVELASWPNRRRDARRTLVRVLARRDPVALSDVHDTPAGVWTFVTRTDAATAALVDLLTDVGIVVLRTQPGSSIATVTASVGDVNEGRYSGAGGDQRRVITAEIQEIAPLPGTTLPLDATLAGLAVYDGDTLAELAQLRPTLLALSQIITGPGVVTRAINV